MINSYEKLKKDQRGFTLVELMVVVVIIGILVAIAVPVYNSTQEKAKVTADKANIRIIEGAIQIYFLENLDKETNFLDGTVNEEHALIKEDYLKDAPLSKNGEYYEITGGKVSESDEMPGEDEQT